MYKISTTLISSLLVSSIFAAEPATSPKPVAATSSQSKEDAAFQEQLQKLLKRTDESIKLVREQIAESQTAPFLPDLYVQLAELLSQKSGSLYYVQMERQKNSWTAVSVDQQFSPVVEAQKEAIAVYKSILKDFPNYSKRRDVLFRLASAYKSIDESLEFVKVAGEIIKDFPDSDDAMRVRLLMGQHYFDMQEFEEAANFLEPVAKSQLLYESNLAKYRLGLINIAREKFTDALTLFEQVISSQQLHEQENPYGITLKKRATKSDLRRDALIDSIRAYTQAFPDNANPVVYYSKLAPNEVYFQEVIEKLSLRYITLKKYENALSLLRTLSERIVDPQKVLNIYQEVLMLIPPERRGEIPLDEMKYVINRYALWIAYYKVPSDIYAKSYFFFEQQLRELGTSAHSLAKTETDPAKKIALYKRAKDFYTLYLSFFNKSQNGIKIAVDLADTFFQLEEYLEAGNLYLKIYRGDYGNSNQKELLLENAILCFQKPGNRNFYENVRMKGLLIKSLQTAIATEKKYAADPKTHMLLLKTEYEQGFFPEVLEKLFAFAQKNRQRPEAVDAGELILDYFNSRKDFAGLDHWSNRLLGLKIESPDFVAKLTTIRSQAKSKQLQEKIKQSSGYDEFAQGKSYLSMAQTSADSTTAAAALQEALTKSRNEKDIQTFVQAATLLAQKESDPKKKFDILKSMSQEYFKMTRYFSAFQPLELIVQNTQISPQSRTEALELALRNSLLLRDWDSVKRYLAAVNIKNLPEAIRTRLKEIFSDLLESPAPFSPEFGIALLAIDNSDETILAFYKAQSKLTSDVNSRIATEIKTRCSRPNGSTLCKWSQVEGLDQARIAMLNGLRNAPTTIEAVQTESQNFMTIANAYQGLSGSGDASLEAIIAIREIEIYSEFKNYLDRVGKANAELASLLKEKADESEKNAKNSMDKCKSIQQKSVSISPVTRFCETKTTSPITELLKWPNIKIASPTRLDPNSEKIQDFQTQVFFAKDPADVFLLLSKEYLDQGHFYHAAASSSVGISLYRESEKKYEAILGCAVLELGFLSEAKFHLQRSDDYAGLKTRCLARIAL